MATLQSTTINDTGYLTLPAGTTAQRPAIPVTGMTRFNTTWNKPEVYNGTNWIDVKTGVLANDGSTALLAANSAADIKTLTGTNANGVYWINLPTVGATQHFCIMDSAYDGGGWMMALKATRGTTFQYSANYWTTANTLNPTENNQNDGDAKFNSFNYYQGKDLLARWPDIGGPGGGAGGSINNLGCWIWLQNNYANRLGSTTTSTMLNLFSTASRLFIQDAILYSGWANGVFSSQTDIRFYGFNWTDNMNCRWGFGWNENGGGLYPNGATGSDDVSGGIGMSYQSYSAGDAISCCQNTTGINRSARVEIYVR